jgi:hypothetical protein
MAEIIPASLSRGGSLLSAARTRSSQGSRRSSLKEILAKGVVPLYVNASSLIKIRIAMSLGIGLSVALDRIRQAVATPSTATIFLVIWSFALSAGMTYFVSSVLFSPKGFEQIMKLYLSRTKSGRKKNDD